MPDMTGWSRKDVTALWQITSLDVKMEGSGKVVSQNIAAGTTVTSTDKIEVIFSE